MTRANKKEFEKLILSKSGASKLSGKKPKSKKIEVIHRKFNNGKTIKLSSVLKR